MDYKAKGKEGTNATGQKKENPRLTKVNKKRVNDDKLPGNERKDNADDISNAFPNFSLLNEEEKLAFFEALSAARRNIEKRGLPTRERFGTVHDEYLEYFARDDKGETVQEKPGSAPSPRPNPSRKSPRESKFTPPESPKQRVPRTSEPGPPSEKTAKPPPKNLRPESEPNDLCESVIKRDTEQMIQIYLDKKKRIEEQWKKSSQANKSPPPTAKPKTKEGARPPTGRPSPRKQDPRPRTTSKPVDSYNTPRSQALDPADRKEFFRILKETHANPFLRNPQQKDGISTLVLDPYKGGLAKATTACPATQNSHVGRQQPKNLRVKVTLKSGDNKRLCRTKSQVLNDSTKEGSVGKSKSLESVVCPDTSQVKQSKIPILRKAAHEGSGSSDAKTETQPVKEITCEDTLAERAPRAAEVKKTEALEKEKTLTVKEELEKGETRTIMEKSEKGKTLTIIEKPEKGKTLTVKEELEKEKTLTIKEEPVKNEEIKVVGKEKEKDKSKDKKEKEASEEWEDNIGDAAGALAETKAELKKVRKGKEKEKTLAEAARKEESLMKKKKKEFKKRHQKELRKKDANKDIHCIELKVVGVRISPEEYLPEEKKKRNECENEALTAEKTNEEKEGECENEALTAEKTNEQKEGECENETLTAEKTNEENEGECEEKIECAKSFQEINCLREDQKAGEVEGDGEEDNEASEESCSSVEEECPCQQSSEPCQQQLASDISQSSPFTKGPECPGPFSSQTCTNQMVKAATQSTKSLAGMSLVERRPEETWQAREMVPTFTTGKVVVVDDNVIERIKDLIQYLERKANRKDSLQSEYVQLVLSYTEYLTKVTESLIRAKEPKKGHQVHRTYAAPEVHLKFDDAPKEELIKDSMPHSVSEDDLPGRGLPGPSGIENKENARRKKSRYDFDLSDSESSSNSEDENRVLSPSTFKKTGIPMTKIRLLQDLLNGRAKFTEGSIDDFKIVHIPEAERLPPAEPPKEEAKEISEAEVEQEQKAVRMKFLRKLVNLCHCGKKQKEEDVILENLKGEAVRVDTTEPKKNPASATINDSMMEVLKAAERKKIIEKYLKREYS